MVLLALFDGLKQSLGLYPIYIPAATGPKITGALMCEGSLEGVLSVSAKSLLQISTYKPFKTVSSFSCPLLLVALEDDILYLLKGREFVAAAIPTSKCELHTISQSEHFDVYPPNKDYERSVDVQIRFL
ncbi:alpha beta hydrolase fold protein [Moniliophthora roreri MCA 2997]|uniref:Alpha beta hydrolase fold protein n=1 Tax=Moniliophthora roreri (strain MCA 2997) TaxID=1381753 RepID=V2XUZ2_MONRO|nr:alpha beta hydrolase fold protein [Moniliophthora roreri MCA 2997]